MAQYHIVRRLRGLHVVLICARDYALVLSLQFQFHLWSSRSARLQPCGRGADTDDEPARALRELPLQRHAGRTHADVEERRFLRSVQGLLAQLAASRTLEHHRIL